MFKGLAYEDSDSEIETKRIPDKKQQKQNTKKIQGKKDTTEQFNKTEVLSKTSKPKEKRTILKKVEKNDEEDEDKSDIERTDAEGFHSLENRLNTIHNFVHSKYKIWHNTDKISNVRDIPRRVIDSVRREPAGDLTPIFREEEDYDEDLDPCRSTLKEYLLQHICREQLIFDTKADYNMLDEIIGMDNNKIRLSSLIYARKSPTVEMEDSRVELNQLTRGIYETTAKMINYLKKCEMIDIDYLEFYSGGSKNLGIFPVPFEKFSIDKKGTCFYRSNLKDTSKSETYNYNKLMAVLSFIKFSMRY